VSYRLDFSVIVGSLPQLLWGCLGTLGLAVAGSIVAIVIGIGGAMVRDSRVAPARWLVMTFVELIRNTPFLVQIYFIFFALPLLGEQLGKLLVTLGIAAKAENWLLIGPWPTAVIALGLNGGAYAIEIIRGGVQSIPKGQWEAGLALGLRRAAVFRLIILKPALRAVYPSLTSQLTLLTLTTSIAGAIAAYELFTVAKFIDSQVYKPFEIYFTVTAFYLVISWLMNAVFAGIARRCFSYPLR
jgi:polar amino acid transport system permease protein